MKIENIPKELRELPQWMCWKSVPKKDKENEFTKKPIDAKTGGAGSHSNPATWADFDTALKHFRESDIANGIGFTFSEDDPYCGIDLDKVYDTKTRKMKKWAADIIKQINSYTEFSPSGTGIHILTKAKVPYPSGRKNQELGFEIYDNVRYYTMTGDRCEEYPATLEERQAEVNAVCLQVFGEGEVKSAKTMESIPSAHSDDEVLQKLRSAGNKNKFNRLFDGDITGYPSDSEADAALAAIIGFYTQDHDQILRIIQMAQLSPKREEKWEREDYQKNTIGGALGILPDFYNWTRGSARAGRISTGVGEVADKDQPRRIFIHDGCYYAYRKAGKEVYETAISNFTIQVKRAIYTPDEVIRQVVFIDTDGEVSESFDLRAAAMVSKQKFSEFCLSRGNYFWDGKADELRELLEIELAKSDGLIYQPDRIGYIAEGKFWLFGNMAVPEGGAPIRPDAEGVMWVGDRGYIPISFEGGEDGGVLPVVTERMDAEAYIKSVLDATYKNLEFNAWLGLGFCAAHVYLPEIVAEYRCFPELFLYGKLKAGKNTLARWLLSFFGLSCPEKTISETSQNWIARALAYYSSMPVWLDEYRNERKIREKNGVIRNVFDRIGSGKGQLGFGGAGYPVRGTILLSGQTLPDDSALLSRNCVIRLTRKSRDDKYLDEVNALAGDLSAILVHLIRHKTDGQVQMVMKSIKAHQQQLIDRGIDGRDATIYAINISGVELLCGDLLPGEVKAFTQWVYENEAMRDKMAKDDESELAVFLDDMTVLLSSGVVNSQHYRLDQAKGRLYLWYSAIYNEWTSDYRRRTGDTPFSRSAILDYFREEQYYISSNTAARIGSITRKCLVLAFDSLPEYIQSAFSGM